MSEESKPTTFLDRNPWAVHIPVGLCGIGIVVVVLGAATFLAGAATFTAADALGMVYPGKRDVVSQCFAGFVTIMLTTLLTMMSAAIGRGMIDAWHDARDER